MSIRSLITEFLDILNPGWSYDEKPRGEEYAGELKRQLKEIRENRLGYDINSCEADIITPTLATVKEVSVAVLEYRVTVVQLEPEIHAFDRIMKWLWIEFRSGRLRSDHPAAQDALNFGSALLEFGIPQRHEDDHLAIAARTTTHDMERSSS